MKLFSSTRPAEPEDPIRAELFSIERLEQHAQSLAAAQKISPKRSRGASLLPRVKDNARRLTRGYRSINRAIRESRSITPASEWLVDNFHIVEDQIREIIDDLPPNYYRELPKLSEGFLKGTPRVYGVAWAFVAHTDSRFDPDWLRRFVRAYQRVDSLTIGEIWALTISLRIVLVENLRRLTERIMLSGAARKEADAVADKLLALNKKDSPDPATLLSHVDDVFLLRPFAVQLVQRLREQGEAVAPALAWLDQQLQAQGTDAESIVRLEHQEQAAMNATVRNVITSMRLISALDWSQFFEDVAVVDEILRSGSNFAAMDFPTRDRYRHAIEELARGAELSEEEVTVRVVRAAHSFVPAKNDDAVEIERKRDPGYYLISKGRTQFEKDIRCKISVRKRLQRAIHSWPTLFYLGSLMLLSGIILAIPLYASALMGVRSMALIAFGIVGLIPASNLAVAIVNFLVMDSMVPEPAAKLDFVSGIPKPHQALVVMPTLLTDRETIEAHLQRLEIHYLGNPDGHLQFALLTDWTDAEHEHEPGDDALLTIALEGIEKLNIRHGQGPDNAVRFFLFHRRRIWNAQQRIWMGWERKRGKLHELNRLLRGDATTSFINVRDVPSNIRYVITLDADTHMPRGAVARLVGAMAHPLNRPRLDSRLGRIVEGYGIMQPRITPTLPMEGFGSLYQKIYSGPAGIDPYAFAVSDVYQDLFKEGSYIGKGIYDVDAFEAALEGGVPDNTMLSHDLFEGLYARAALLSDVALFEEFPSHYEAAMARNHRWVRGDWQLLPWILGRKNSPSPIGRWKMIDNLRRSLSAPANFLGLLGAWTVKDVPAMVWIGFILSTMSLPALLPVLSGFLPRARKVSILNHVRSLWLDLRLALVQIFLSVVFLAHQTWMMSDAITRTLYRMIVSRRNLLEWTSAAISENLFDYKLSGYYLRQASVAILAGATVALALAFGPRDLWWEAWPFVCLWMAGPFIAQRLSLPMKDDKLQRLSNEDRQYLRLIARKTWAFFETFVTSKHHFLPPDNFQEIPQPAVAHRTSPTNIGLYLLSTVAARDFGWIGVLETVERIEATMATIKILPKYQGHLFNWYDTRELRPLDPLYVSTVDSGNLAGHLWTVANACREFAREPNLRTEFLAGLQDVIALIQESSHGIIDDRRTETVTSYHLQEALARISASFAVEISDPKKFLDELKEKAVTLVDIARALVGGKRENQMEEILRWSEIFLRQIESHARDLGQRSDSGGLSILLRDRLNDLAEACESIVRDMRFGFLFDPLKKIFSIGYQANEKKLDSGYYDLLASEARLASFVAIAKGDVPALHWFRLSRSFRALKDGLALLSWSGSMFEYLMPALIMRAPAESILNQTDRRIVRRQIAYGRDRAVPWGVSESAYNVQNMEFTYQYSNFGVPGLGLRRGLSEDLVIAPYATALAAMIDPSAALKNFWRLEKAGAKSRFGFYEALDYTTVRLPENQKTAIVYTSMAHHQAMSLVALTNVIYGGIMQHRFHALPQVQATELLLQEKTPRDVPVAQVRTVEMDVDVRSLVPLVWRRFNSPHDVVPRTHLLSNGRYSVMVTAAGSGYSKSGPLAVTRWREDVTCDNWGTYIFLRDVQSAELWSAGYQPTCVQPDHYEVDFSEERAEIVRRDGTLTTTLEVVVSSEDDAEIRRVTIKNNGGSSRVIDVTSYGELVLALPAADQAHPAFSNLFIQTEFVPEVNGLICTRRPRSSDDPTLWMGHVVVVEGETSGELQYESDRAQFLGRGRDVHSPLSIVDGKPLSNTVGAVLDPIVSLRRRVRVKPGESVRIAFTTMVAPTREEALGLADKYHDPSMFERTVTLAWTHAQIQRHHLGLELAEAHLFQDLASRIIYSHKGMRASPEILRQNNRGAPGLWPHAISGDIPIVLVRIDEPEDLGIVRDLLRAHEYWRMKNLAVDLVIINEKASSYVQDLQIGLENLVRTTQAMLRHDTHAPHGGIFILRLDQLSLEDHLLLRTAARVTLLSRHGTLAQQVERLKGAHEIPLGPPGQKQPQSGPSSHKQFPEPNLQFFNGLGGFSGDGKEYVTVLEPGQWTPAPWVNVIANPNFGFNVSESGAGSTWSINSRENKITGWSNDPVCDPSGEIFYIRDEESGDVWTPTASPIREETSPYMARHGKGYSRFEHASHGILTALTQFVPLHDSIKISRMTLTNKSNRTKRLSITGYVEWVMGASRSVSAPFLVTEVDDRTGAILARNPWNNEFSGRIAFAGFSEKQKAWTCDRTEFIGRNGSLARPRGLELDSVLAEKAGAGLDACAALQTEMELSPGQTIESVFFLGEAADRKAAVELVQRARRMNLDSALQDVQKHWDAILGTLQVRTPDLSMDLLLNRWLLYQTLACRMWSRSGFYQSGGAYGFRDQLQDAMALIVPRRDLAREHILRAAQRQFPEGDVQHWWHPPSGRGVRTKISDDLIWLPYVLINYLEVTGDAGILDEPVSFLAGGPIPDGKEEFYFQPEESKDTATLFEHCARALDHNLSVGNHGLPLMGSGDWNDGMNRVGNKGKGESVWLAWFMHTTLWEFAKLAQSRGELERAEKWRLHVGELKSALERNGWDGEWYRRAYFDDGSPLGSSVNSECRIDSIAQSWGVLSGGADPVRATKAMQAVKEKLLREDDKLLLLFTPPFNVSDPSPGYIQGYLPGVRENGGQYTHGAIWTLMAFAELGDGNLAGELFSLLNPINHGKSRADIYRYKVEPYVMAGDIYSEFPHVGRGGWTWYTGSAGVMYRAGVEWILGFRLRETKLYIDPCIPSSWPGYEMSFRYHSSRYEIKVENPKFVSRGVHSASMDEKPVRALEGILLVDDGAEHRIRIVLGSREQEQPV